eukprot:scaffold29995_cov71-Phaeocystis_antarctica.AAC.1
MRTPLTPEENTRARYERNCDLPLSGSENGGRRSRTRLTPTQAATGQLRPCNAAAGQLQGHMLRATMWPLQRANYPPYDCRSYPAVVQTCNRTVGNWPVAVATSCSRRSTPSWARATRGYS